VKVKLPRARIHSAVQTAGPSILSEENMREFWQSCHADIDTISEKDTSYVINGDPIEYLFINQHNYFSQRELHADTPSMNV